MVLFIMAICDVFLNLKFPEYEKFAFTGNIPVGNLKESQESIGMRDFCTRPKFQS